MNALFYPKLAVTNIKKNKRTYFPYMFISICTIAMFYILYSIAVNENMGEIYGGHIMTTILMLGVIIIGIFAWIIIFYTNTFLIKRRKKELGLYTILGMEKKHLAAMIFFETLFIALVNIITGILLGILLSKLLFLVLLKLVRISTALSFSVSYNAIIFTCIVFMAVFMMTLLTNMLSIRKANPIQLLSGAKSGEKEPKSKWIITIIGVIFLGIGYYIALTVKSPIDAMLMFFVAVICVMIGTYCLFTSGTVTILKALKKNENYYYKTKHFISVSGLIYRMKQNAVGLANICILSTAVLVTVSTTVSLYAGTEDTIKKMYPFAYYIRNTTIYEDNPDENEDIIKAVEMAKEESGITFTKYVDYEYCSILAEKNSPGEFSYTGNYNTSSLENYAEFLVIPSESYERYTGTDLNLSDSEVMIYSLNTKYEYDTIDLCGLEYTVKGTADRADEMNMYIYDSMGIDAHILIANDIEIINSEYNLQRGNVLGDPEFAHYQPEFCAGFDIDKNSSKDSDIKKFDELLEKYLSENTTTWLTTQEKNRIEIFSLYGGLLFIGVFLGIMFLMATVMIIYYKQVSEGYDDKDRFVIMQKVGMSRVEVKESIRSQILTVFFLPLITAVIHICFAFPLIKKMLILLNLPNLLLFVTCTIICVVVFALIYTIVYSLTARTYYKIVGS